MAYTCLIVARTLLCFVGLEGLHVPCVCSCLDAPMGHAKVLRGHAKIASGTFILDRLRSILFQLHLEAFKSLLRIKLS